MKQVGQFVGCIGYYRRFIQDFAGLSEPLVSLTRKGVTFAWTDRQQGTFDTLKTCLLNAPILGFPTEDGRFVLGTDASLFAVGRVLNQIQDDQEVVIAYASRNLRLSHRWYCTTQREMFAAVVIFAHTYRVPSSYCARIIVHFVGCRSFGTVMSCWLAGICCWDNSQLCLNTDRGLSMLMPMAFPVSVDSVCDRAVRYRLPKCTPGTRIRCRSYWISPLHRRLWAIPWMWTFCLNYPERLGWRPPCWRGDY